MIRILYIAILTLPLCAFQCKGPEAERMMATVFGDAAAGNSVPFALTEQPMVETVGFVEEVIVPPEPPPCVDYLNRGQWFDCHGNWLRDL